MRRVRVIVSLSLLILFIVGCTADNTITPTQTIEVIQPVSASTITPIIVDTQPDEATATRRFTATVQPTTTPISVPSITPLPLATISTVLPLTATFDASQRITRTPAPEAQCPQENPTLIPDFSSMSQGGMYTDKSQPVLDFLNAGGTRQIVIQTLCNSCTQPKDGLFERDLTGDGVAELIYGWSYVYIFGCRDGKYEVLFKAPDDNDFYYAPYIITASDMNLDGIADLVFAIVTSNGPTLEFRIIEWNGGQFQSLIQAIDHEQPVDYASMDDPRVMEIRDTDGNDTLELVLIGGIPRGAAYFNGLPFREETWIYTWNGANFVAGYFEYAPPQYRFQAVQDGDRAALAGDYDEALDYYQQAIFSDKLEWWSEERRRYLQDTYYDTGGTLIPSPAPDSNEYPNIAAYSRFRIMLLHILRGWLPEAQTVYDTLQEKFPDGQSGHAYAEMATAFWEEYMISQDVGLACGKAISFAEVHQSEILVYLGNVRDIWNINGPFFHGWQSLEYGPQDICPFK